MADISITRSTISNSLTNIINSLLPNNSELFNNVVASEYINPDQYVTNLYYSSTTTFPTYTVTPIVIGAPFKSSYGAIYKPWKGMPFAFIFDWFPGLVMVNGWTIELIMQMSIYYEFHQQEGILPFCLNLPGQDRIDWESCKDYSHTGISSWQINKTSNKYPTKWLGLYFEENLGTNHNYNGENHFTYWLNKWNEGYIPKICIYGIIDNNGIPEFNSGSATDDITLTILNESIPGQLENVHIDAYSAGTNCGSLRKDWQIIATEEVTTFLSSGNVILPTGQMSATTIQYSTAITSATTINYATGVIPLPHPGQKIIKIDPNTGATWISFDGGINWYIEDTITLTLKGPYTEPYWGMYNKIILPGGSPYWENPWSNI